MLENLLPPGIISSEGPILAAGWDATSEEFRHAAAFAEKRRREYLTGRTYARVAVLRHQPEAPTLAADVQRCPLWPPGLVGSITHSRTYCAAVVARSGEYRAIGLDLEDIGRAKESLRRLICLDSEAARLNGLPVDRRDRFLSLIFSAKEAFFKMQYPLTRAWVGFLDAEVTWDEGGFSIELKKNVAAGFGKGDSFQGRYLFTDSRVAAGMALPAGHRPL